MLTRILPGLVLMALGLALFFVLIPLGVQAPGYVQPNSLRPRDLPSVLAVIVAAAGLGIVLAGATLDGQAAVSPGPVAPLRALAFGAALSGFVALLPVVGTTAAVFAFTGGLLVARSRLGPWRSLALAALFAATLRVVFVEVAGIPLPGPGI